ncbi:MAG TPA: methyltransferase domain-containing protein [Thiobacillaceae bacterium]|nr:methyltransferase domain-containing protein [Thiobacillaceae bacterium]
MNKVVLGASHFDSKAREWDSDPVFIERARRIADAIRRAVPLSRNMHALDYGCGTGLQSFALKDELGHITLIDDSAGMLEVLNEKILAQGVSNMRARLANLSAGALPAERFDLIYTSMTLHHVPDTGAILQSFHTLLHAGSYLCVADLDQEDGSFHGAEVDVHPGFARAELAALTRQAGFGNVRFETVFEIAKETGGGTRTYPVFLMVAQKS